MGWVLAGSLSLADRILLNTFERDRTVDFRGPTHDTFENLFVWAFNALDQACYDGGRIRPLFSALQEVDLAFRLHALPYELRVATLLITIEGFTPELGAKISGRTAARLACDAAAAAQRLDDV
ncbi:MAG: hypothetical protein AAGH87_11160 [Pseudomonadota bacterium]